MAKAANNHGKMPTPKGRGGGKGKPMVTPKPGSKPGKGGPMKTPKTGR